MKQDLLYETWCKFRYGNPTPELNEFERGRINKGLKALRAIHATPDGLLQRAQEFRRRWPGCECTITGVAAHWTSLGSLPPQDPKKMDDRELMAACRQKGIETSGKTRNQLIEKLMI